MGTIWVKELTGGLDTRKMEETTPGGALIKAQDGHLNRGGEFEQRPAFVHSYNVPVATKGLAKRAGLGLYVFGHATAPTMPAGVTYQRLQHPDGTTALEKVLCFDLFANKLYVVAQFADGEVHHFYDGARVTDWYDGRAAAQLRVAGGDDIGPSQLTSLTVDGVELLSGPVDWDVSNAETAAAIADEINSTTTSPEYEATSFGEFVNVIAVDAGAAANFRYVLPTVAAGLVMVPTAASLTGGVDAGSTQFQPGNYVKTIGRKMYSVSGPYMHASGLSDPTGWTTDSLGAFFVDMSAEAAGAEDLRAISRYQTFAAVFGEGVILIYFIDPDPELNKLVQTLSNTGTVAGKSVVGFGDNDLFYLSNSGVRSLRARDASNAAATTDIGVPVDDLLVAKMKTLNSQELQDVNALIEPSTGRFWLVFQDIIYIFSYFPGSKVSAWSTYLPTYVDIAGMTQSFTIDEITTYNNRVYLRSGEKIFSFGGTSIAVAYDATSPKLWLPYLDGGAPAKKKILSGLDVACRGEWVAKMGLDPNNVDTDDQIGVVHQTTFNEPKMPAEGESTHFSLRFEGQGPGFKKIGAAVIHYDGEEDED